MGRLSKISYFSLWAILVVPLSAQYVSIFDTSVYEHDRSFVHNGNFPLTDEIDTLDPLIVELGLSTDDASQSVLDKPSPKTPNDSFSNFLLRWADSQNFQNPSAEKFISDLDSEQWCIPKRVSNVERTYERLGDENLIPQISAFLDDFTNIGDCSFLFFNLPADRFGFDASNQSDYSHDYNYSLTDKFLSKTYFLSSLGKSTGISGQANEFSDGQDSDFCFRPASLNTIYPNFTFIPKDSPKFSFNAFSENPFIPIRDHHADSSSEKKREISPSYIRSNRQRRASWNLATSYEWEINDFDPTNTFANPVGVSEAPPFDTLDDFNVTEPTTENKVHLYVSAYDGIGSLSVLAYGMTGGNALNDYTGINGFKFMTATGWDTNLTDVSNYFNLETGSTSGIDLWMNGFDASSLWGVYKNGNDFYLTYEFSKLNFSPVPEPSTYFMTGVLFCLLGFNQSSRNSMKKLLFLLLVKFSSNYNTKEVEKKVS